MKSSTLSIGRKLVIGLSAMLILMAVIIYLSFTGINKIIGNADDVIDGNSLLRAISQHEVELIKWANSLNAMLTDENITTLEVETDDHKCPW